MGGAGSGDMCAGAAGKPLVRPLAKALATARMPVPPPAKARRLTQKSEIGEAISGAPDDGKGCC